jgi:hypothetical protein
MTIKKITDYPMMTDHIGVVAWIIGEKEYNEQKNYPTGSVRAVSIEQQDCETVHEAMDRAMRQADAYDAVIIVNGSVWDEAYATLVE